MKDKQRFFLALVAIHLFYFIVALIYKKISNADSPEYLWMAFNIKTYGMVYSANAALPIDPFFISLRTPGYSLFILIAQWFSSSVYVILIAQNLVSLLVFLLLYKLLDAYNFTFKSWKLIIVTLLLYPATLRLANSILSDSLLQAIVFFSFYMMVAYIRVREIKYLVFYNILITIALFVKPALLFFWIPNMFFSIYLFILNEKPAILLLSLILPLSIWLWCLRNQKETGFFHFSSITSQDIVECYSYNALMAKHGRDYADSVRTSIIHKSESIKDFKKWSEYMNNEGTRIIKDNITSYIYVHIRGMFSFMLDPGRQEIISFFPYNPNRIISFLGEVDNKGLVKGVWYYLSNVPLLLLGYLALVFLWNLILFISLLHFLFSKKIAVLLRLAVFIYVGYFCSVSVIGGSARYKNAVLPILIFTLPFFIEALKPYLKKYRIE